MPVRTTDRRTNDGASARRLLVLVLVGLSPWIVVVFPTQIDLLFSWGWINTDPVNVVTMREYLFQRTLGFRTLPRHLQAWPVTTLLYALAVASAAGGCVLNSEDRRVTAGLVLFAALSLLHLTVGLARPDATPVPVGPVLMVAVVWWYDGSRFVDRWSEQSNR